MDLLSWGDAGWADELVQGALVTIAVATLAYVVGILIATPFAAMKLSSSTYLAALATLYTTAVRGVPELLIIYLVYFGSGKLIMLLAEGLFGYSGYIELPIFVTGVLCIAVSSGAYSTEVIRGAVLAIPVGQLDAARAVGMPKLVRFRRILVPQVLRYGLSGLSNVWLFTLKDTSLLSVIGLAEIMRQAYVGAGATREPFTFFIAAFALYALLALISNRFFWRAEVWAQRGVRSA